MTKVTRSLIASKMGIERAEKALIDLGINKTGLEKRLGFSRSTISSFFSRTKPIDHPYFTKICKTLNLEWEEIVEKDNPMKFENSQIENIADIETISPRLAAFVIEGSFPIDALTRAKIQALVKQLQKITGDASLEIVDIQEGSIKIILKGSPEALATIQDLYNSGQLNELVKKADLSGADLSGADLSGADLSGADLSGADLSGADLSGADLSGADLSGARLFGVELFGAELRSRFRLPLYLNPVAAGFPTYPEDYIEGKIDLNRHLVKHPDTTFLVRVVGESMKDAGIHPNDMLIVDRSIEVTSGQVVIALVNGELTVKRIRNHQNKLWLMPENESFRPIEIDENTDLHIWGVVTNVIHSL
ncbi:translesion error-prone DNA polymerase V autoproteolytic subunit [Pseudanabaena sp. lw0831]|uniref:translesion error-prone DNA polymerase V autoproteolytic subunit n=1 Tax=Pseudanabaena sp. lw0831 TaxID=1357935 RepID=UPI00191631EE|nr:translesion error-prone DNA polymerase V autoproteolytic subunit [Pseudanabaena sp. lw0831]